MRRTQKIRRRGGEREVRKYYGARYVREDILLEPDPLRLGYSDDVI